VTEPPSELPPELSAATRASEADLDAFAARADELEARIADAEARGEALPPQARAMLASLRELARAVEGLRASMGEPLSGEPPPGESPPGESPPDESS
jgi:hypothetical protein